MQEAITVGDIAYGAGGILLLGLGALVVFGLLEFLGSGWDH